MESRERTAWSSRGPGALGVVPGPAGEAGGSGPGPEYAAQFPAPKPIKKPPPQGRSLVAGSRPPVVLGADVVSSADGTDDLCGYCLDLAERHRLFPFVDSFVDQFHGCPG